MTGNAYKRMSATKSLDIINSREVRIQEREQCR